MIARARDLPSALSPGLSYASVMGGLWRSTMGSCHTGPKREACCCSMYLFLPSTRTAAAAAFSCPPPRPGIWELFHGRLPPAEQQHRRPPATTGDGGGGTAAGACCCCSLLNLPFSHRPLSTSSLGCLLFDCRFTLDLDPRLPPELTFSLDGFAR